MKRSAYAVFAAIGAVVLVAGVVLSSQLREREPAGTVAPAGLERVRVLGEESGVEWSDVRGAAFLDDDLVVVTRTAPSVHLFTEDGYTAWGRQGSGPAELKDPSMVTVLDDRVLVYDLELAKLASYKRDGSFAGTRQVGIVNGLFGTGRDTVVGRVDIMGAARSVLRLRGGHADTLFEYHLPERIQLTAPGSPSYTVVRPYTAVPQWAALPGGRLVTWDSRSPHLVVRGLAGDAQTTFPLDSTRYAVAAPDRDLWLNESIPAEFMGQRVFEPLREEARRSLPFPKELPAVLAIKADPADGAWVQMTTSATGELWTLVGHRGVRASFRLPVGRKLLAVGRTEVAVLARDENDIESVEVYRKPAVARTGARASRP